MTLVEAIACLPDDAVIAQASGVKRLEICSAMSAGGLTPSAGAFRCIRAATSLPLVAMIRPRPSGFYYSSHEFQTMIADAEILMELGADSLVFGMLDDTGEIDVSRCREFIARFPETPIVFHRAFDAIPEPLDALETLIDLGVMRVLTSGQAPTALQGADVVRKLIEAANGRIEVMPGGGVRPETAKEILAISGATQVHLGPFTSRTDSSVEHSEAASRLFGATYPVIDGETLAKVVRMLDG